MESFQDIEHFVKTLSAAIKKKIPTKVSQLTNDVGYKTTDTTYKLSKSGSTVTLTGSDGSTTSVTDDNATYSSLKNPYSLDIQNNGTTVASYDGSTAKTANFTNATTSANGLMSAADKSKLDGVASTYATKGELNDQISSVKAGAIDQIVNLTAAGWTGDAAPYSQTVNVTGMTDELLCELFSACPKAATVAEREAYNEAFALVASGYAETADGSATFLVDEKPAIDIGVRIKSISKANAVSDQTSSDISNAVDAMSNTLEGRVNALSADLAKQNDSVKSNASAISTLNSNLAQCFFISNASTSKQIYHYGANCDRGSNTTITIDFGSNPWDNMTALIFTRYALVGFQVTHYLHLLSARMYLCYASPHVYSQIRRHVVMWHTISCCICILSSTYRAVINEANKGHCPLVHSYSITRIGISTNIIIKIMAMGWHLIYRQCMCRFAACRTSRIGIPCR